MHNLEIRKGEQSFLCVTHCPDLIHILIKLWLLSYGAYNNVDRNMDEWMDSGDMSS